MTKIRDKVNNKQVVSDVDIINLYYNTSFSSMIKACLNHDVYIELYKSRRSRGYSVEESYGIIKLLNYGIKNYVLFDGLTVQHNIRDKYFLCTLNGADSVLHHDDIIDYYRNHVLGCIIKEKEPSECDKHVEQRGAYDHNQRFFESIAAMCEHYGIRAGAYQNRIRQGWSKKDALTKPIQTYAVQDHVGKEFSSESEMCKHYNVSQSVYTQRKKKGWTVEECLFGKNRVKDHLGNTFTSEKEMYEHYGVNRHTYHGRKARGMSLEECLLGPKEPVVDHLGQQFESVYAMCEHYGITYYAYRSRRQRGMNLEERLTFKDNVHRGEIYDHKGNRFGTIKDMLKYWGVDHKTYGFRRDNGWSLKECLEGKEDSIIDHLGNTFSSEAKKCKHWNIQQTTYSARKKKGYIEEECLGLMPLINGRTFDLHVDSNLTIIRPILNNMFSCMCAGVETSWSREQIINYYRKNIIDYRGEK